jgi:hypothetical protein
MESVSKHRVAVAESRTVLEPRGKVKYAIGSRHLTMTTEYVIVDTGVCV